MISVIVPVYNAEKYIKKCIDSILQQTYKNLEIILVDDASQDKSMEICLEYQNRHSNIYVQRMKNNSGQVSAYMKGIEMSRGEWIGFVDSDDWIEPDMYERLVQSQQKHKTDIACCGIYMDFPAHSITEPSQIKKYDNLVLSNEEIRDEFLELRKSGNKINEVYKLYRCTKIYRRDIVENNLKYLQKNIRVFEDNNFVIPCMLDAKAISYVGKPLYHYVRRANSTMGSFNDEILQSNKSFLDNLKRIYLEKQVQHIFDSDAFITTAFSLNGILQSASSWKKKAQQLHQLRKDIESYELSLSQCKSFGASYKLAIMIQMLKKKRYFEIRVLGWIYRRMKKSKNE